MADALLVVLSTSGEFILRRCDIPIIDLNGRSISANIAASIGLQKDYYHQAFYFSAIAFFLLGFQGK
jgi:hypothetical protein